MRQLLAITLISWLFCPLSALAWWETGHQTVGRLALAHLTPAARIRLARIFDLPENSPGLEDAVVRASIWADDTKNDTKTGEWHYIDLALQDERTDFSLRCKNNDCITARIRIFAQQLSTRSADSKWSQLDAVRFLLHFVGDVHQPLHAVSDADLGGNCELLESPIGTVKNLHALWDGGIVNAMDVDDKTLAAQLEAEIKKFGPSELSEMAGGNADDWAWESHELALKNVYGRLHIPTEPVEFPARCSDAPGEIRDFKPQIDSLYIDDMKPIVRSQLMKAGLRLARLLNESL